jgi:hypothetical protein
MGIRITEFGRNYKTILYLGLQDVSYNIGVRITKFGRIAKSL